MSLYPSADVWTVSPEQKAKHERLFQSMNPLQGKVSGEQAKRQFMKSNLPTPTLGQIWSLSDLDHDGRMTLQEFTIAMHLVECKLKGMDIPRTMPGSLRSSTDPSNQAFPAPTSTPNTGSSRIINGSAVGMMGVQTMPMGGMQGGMTPMMGGGMGMQTPMGMNMGGMVGGGGMGMQGNFGMQGNMGMQHGNMGMQQGNMGMQQGNMGMQQGNMGMHQGNMGMGMQGTMGIQGNMGMQPMGMNFGSNTGFGGMAGGGGGFIATPGAINRVGSTPVGSSSGFGNQQRMTQHQQQQSFTLPNQNSNKLPGTSVFSSNSSGGIKGPAPSSNTSAFDSLAIGSLTGLKSGGVGAALTPSLATPSISNISAPNRLRYTQMFKAADHEKTGYLAGEHARQLLIQSNVSPQALAQIWELSDINKDGRLELDEFIIAMHLIDSMKAGMTIPDVLPNDIIPPQFKNVARARSDSTGSRGRSSSQSEDSVSFEDRRKMNWDKGQAELAKRRRELQEKNQREKDERERKEREEEERRRAIREEAERRRLQELENERRQKEEMEREQEMLRKKMIEQRLAAQLEVERQRQKEWEKRRKEELLNQKGLEENIIKELKLRLTKLKTELETETTSRDSMASSYEAKKMEGRELHAAIEKLNQQRDIRLKDISKLQSELQQSQTELTKYIADRERFTLELNNDSTTTSEALGALRSSVQQMKQDITRLRKNLVSIESEAVIVLKDANKINEQHKEIRVLLHKRMNEGMTLKQQVIVKKQAYEDRKRAAEHIRRRSESQSRKQEEMKKKLESSLQQNKQREQEAMKKEREVQEVNRRQNQMVKTSFDAQKREAMKLQAEAVLKKQQQQHALKNKDEIVKKHQEPPAPLDSTAKVPPPRPRQRPQGSPTKESLGMNFDSSKFQSSKPAAPDASTKPFVADFGANFTADLNAALGSKNAAKDVKKPPPRPSVPSANKDDSMERKKKEQEEAEQRRKAEDAEVQRLLREKMEIERLKREQDERDRQLAVKLQKEEDERARKEQQERMQQQQQQQQQQKEKEKEEEKKQEKKRKEAEVKRKVEEMQRKKMQKKVATPKAPPERPVAAPEVTQYVKKSVFKMMFPFEARNPDELHLAEGDIVQVDESDTSPPPGWLRGSCKGASGLFPANYATKMQTENFSDYVDLDPKSNVSEPPPPIQKQVPRPRPLSVQIETKSEPFPKLRPVAKKNSSGGGGAVAPQRPRSAMLPPTGPLKPLQPPTIDISVTTKQGKTSEKAAAFPGYEFVAGPPREATAGAENEDLYAVPQKAKSVDNLHQDQPEPVSPFSNAIDEDIYQVPGETVAAGESMGEGIQVIALYPYIGKKEDHLSFNKNDYIHVQQQEDPWWFGEFNGKTGWFPKSYVKPVGSGKMRSLSQAEPSTPTVVEEPAHTELKECIALFDYAGQEGDLSFSQNDVIQVTKMDPEVGWWEGTCNGITGMFPANYVEKREPSSSVALATAVGVGTLAPVTMTVAPIAPTVETPEFPSADTPHKPEVATVVSKYVAEGPSEISLNVGQLVHVILKNPDGWWQGELQVRGKNKPNGWFPGNHVKLMQKASKGGGSGDVKDAPLSTFERTASISQQPAEDIYSVPAKKDNAEQVLAMFSYTAQNEDELTFYKGSVISVLSKDGEWWKGEMNGEIGVFPFNYVQVLRGDENAVTSQWSGSFDVTLLKSMTNTEKQRQNHIYELINTEQDYMNDLSLTLEVFYNPIAEANMLSEHELHTVFINWKELIMCNMKFLKALIVRKKMSETDKIEGIGDILVEQLPRFWPYVRFCSCMLNACRLLQEKVEHDPEFKAFEKRCAGDSRLKQNLPLSSYLLKPLQRITKYPLLISGILKYTPEDSYDREYLLQALEKAEEVCSQVNEGVRSQENSNRLEWLQDRVNLEGLEEKLAFNSSTNCLGQRKYMYHGTLHKHKSNKELKAFLFNDFLLLCKIQTPAKTGHGIFHPENDVKLAIYKKPIFLNEVIVKKPTDPEANETLFHISHIDRVLSFRAANKNDRNSWVNNVQQASQVFIETERDKRNRATRARSMGDSEVGRLVVTIIEGADLHPSDPTGTSDPYCEVSMGSQEHRTKVIQKDLNPKWNSMMVFTIKDLDKDVLCITVFDRDFFSPNDFLGRTEVSVASIMKEGKGPITKRLLLHEVATGELVVMLELQNIKVLS